MIIINAVVSASLGGLIFLIAPTTTVKEWAWFVVIIWAILTLDNIGTSLRNMRNALYDVRVQVMTRSELPLKVELQKDIPTTK